MTPEIIPGWKYFPCAANSKKPVAGLDQWFACATDDLDQIAAWDAAYPGCNWGLAVGPSGLAVIDVDVPDGESSLTLFELEHGSLPDTRVHRSPSGGYHIIFSDPNRTCPNSVSSLGPKLDTRGGGNSRNGYIMVPPSVIDGKSYEVVSDVTIAPLPPIVAELAGRKRDAVAAGENAELDQPQNISGARRLLDSYVQRGDVAREGSGGDNRTYQVAAEILNLGLSVHAALSLIEEVWNPHCVPPWDADELRVKVENASRYAQNEAGAWAVPPVHERIAPEILEKLIAASDAASECTSSEFPSPKLARDLCNGSYPIPWYVIDGLALGGHVNLLGGDGGVGKTTLAIQGSICVAAGKPFLGRQTKQMPVLLVLCEDGPGATKDKIQKICASLDVEPGDINLEVWSVIGHDATLAYMNDDGSWTPGPFLPVLEARLASYGQRIVLILDNVADVAVLDETKRGPVNTFIKRILGGLCERYSTTILLISHPSKAAMADGSGYAGSTAWHNAVRLRLSLERLEDSKSGNRRSLRVAKNNYGETGELDLFLMDGVFLTREDKAPADQDARLMDACVSAALAAAEQGTPIQWQRKPPKWVFDEIEREAGRRPTLRELRMTLDYASRAGRVRYLKGNNRRMAGFYPWDQQRAADLAGEAKRHATEVEALSANATKREANNG